MNLWRRYLKKTLSLRKIDIDVRDMYQTPFIQLKKWCLIHIIRLKKLHLCVFYVIFII